MFILWSRMALWPFVASDPSSDVEFAQVQQSIEPWVAELDQKESWQEVDGDIEGVVETLNQHFPLGMKARGHHEETNIMT